MIRTGWEALALGWRASPRSAAGRLLLTAAAALTAPLVAWLGKLLVDELSRGTAAQLPRVTTIAVAGAVAGASGLLASQVAQYLAIRHDAAVTLRAESDLFARVCSFVGLRHFEDPDFQDRLAVAEQSAAEGPSAVTNFAQDVVRASLAAAGFLVAVAVVWPAVAGLLLVAAAPGLVAEIGLARRHAAASMEVSPLQRRRFFYRSMLTDGRAAKEVRLFGLGDFFRSRQLQALRASQDITVRLAARTTIVQSGLNLLGAALAGLAVVVVVRRVVLGELTAGDVLLFTTAVAGVQSSLSVIVGEIGMASRSLRLFQRYLEVMRAPSDLPDSGTATPAPALRRCLRFEDVWFRYTPQSPWVLRGVSFELAAGTSLGLVGVNGAGKSTLVKLLCRFYDPERGRILWDGVDLRELSPPSLRARLAATFQDFMTYDLSVADNIGVGHLPRREDPEALRRAARGADLDGVIDRLPRGYRTMLSRIFADEGSTEPGVTLSGGLWQRLALARSLMREDADVLVLDEPSAGLDADAEARVHRTLREFRRGRTCLLISHRLGSLREADRILVLDRGEITEQGGHDELVGAGGVYARLFHTQAHGYRERPAGLAR